MQIWRFAFILVFLLLNALGFVQAGEGSFLIAHAVDWSPDGRWIAVKGNTGLWLFDVENPESDAIVYFAEETVSSAAFDLNGDYLAIATGFSGAELVQVIALETGSIAYELETETTESNAYISTLAYSGDGRLLLAVNNSTLNFFDTETGERVSAFNVSSPATVYTAVAIEDTGLFAVQNSIDSMLIVDEEGVTETYGALRNIYEIASLEDNFLLFNGIAGISLFNFETAQQELIIPPYEYLGSSSIGISPDKSKFVYGIRGFWQVYELASGELLLETPIDAVPEAIIDIDFHPVENRFVSLQTDGVITTWDMETGEVLDYLGDFVQGIQ